MSYGKLRSSTQLAAHLSRGISISQGVLRGRSYWKLRLCGQYVYPGIGVSFALNVLGGEAAQSSPQSDRDIRIALKCFFDQEGHLLSRICG